jgi:uncharacterized membrane protein
MVYSAIEDAVVVTLLFYITGTKFTEILKEDCWGFKNNDFTIHDRPTYNFVTGWYVRLSFSRVLDLWTSE